MTANPHRNEPEHETHPSKMEGVYVRRRNTYHALGKYRCPVCGITVDREPAPGKPAPWCDGIDVWESEPQPMGPLGRMQ